MSENRLHHSRRASWLVLCCVLAAGCGGDRGTSDRSSVGAPVEVDFSAADPEAVAKLHEMIDLAKERPDDATRRGELGMAYGINGFQQAAMRSYEQAAALDPSDARWVYLLAIARSKSGDLEGALEALDRSLAIDDTYVSSHLYGGQWLLDQGKFPEAEAAYRRALELAPDLSAGQIGLGRALIGQGRADEAVALLEQASAEGPDDPALFQALAEAYRAIGDVKKSREAMRKGPPGTQPAGWPDPWSDRKLDFLAGYGADMLQAEAFLQTGRNAEAVALLEALRKKRPDDLQMLNNLSVAYRRIGKAAESLEVLEKGLEAHPDYFPFHLNVATAYERSGDPERAIEHLDRVIEINPSLAVAYQRKGYLLIRLNRLEEALAAYESALSRDPADVTNYLYAGTIAAELDQCDRALPRLETATTMQPNLFPAHVLLAECRAKLGDFAGAEASLERVAEINPESKNLAAIRKLIDERKSAQP